MNIMSQMLDHRKRRSISLRLLFLVVLCSSFFTLLSSMYQLYFYYQDDVNSIHDNMAFVQHSYLLPISGSLYALDYEQLDLLLQSAIQLQDLEYIEILESRGGKEIKREVGDPNTSRDLVRKFPLEYVSPISKDTYPVGMLTVVASFDNIYRRTWKKAIVVIVTNAVKMFLASFCILIIFQSVITRHLVNLAEFTRRLNLQKDYTLFALDRKTGRSWKPDEFDQVVEALNTMQETIRVDIEKREEAEEQLRKSEQKYHSLFASVNEGVCLHRVVYDQQGHSVDYEILEMNPAYEMILGITPEEAINRLATQLYGTDTPPYMDIFLKVAETGEPVSFETCFPPMEKHFKISVFSPGKGQFATLFADITERKQIEKELRNHRDHLEELVRKRTAELSAAKEQALEAQRRAEAAQRASEAANQAKSVFLANMSHELRTPLNAILGFSQILERQKNLTDTQKYQARTIHSSGKYLLTLISDILDISRIEARKEDVTFDEFNLPTLIHEILSITKVNAIEKGLELRCENGNTLPAIVRSDARKLRQVLLNLLGNAIKYTHEGSVTFHVQRIEPGDVEDRTRHSSLVNLQFQIADTGIGIPNEKLEAAFEPFTRLQDADQAVSGTGLGLAISRRLVELMGGTLFVESQVGKGSIFTVELALEVVAEVAEASVNAPQRAVIGYTGERKRILLVDDNPANLALLFAMLDPLGFEMEMADDGNKATRMVAQFRPHLVLMDLLMPGIDGHETLRRIRNTEFVSKTPIVGVSAAVADKTRIEAFAAECNDFVSKPVDIKDLLPVLKTQLQLDWIWEDADAATVPASVEMPEKRPPCSVIEELLHDTERGDFSGLIKRLDALEAQDPAYHVFCDQIRVCAKRFDDDAIITYLSSMT